MSVSVDEIMSTELLEAKMRNAWRDLEVLTFELATRNGSDLHALRKRISNARERGLTILCSLRRHDRI